MTLEKRNEFLERIYDFQMEEKKDGAHINAKNNEHYAEELAMAKYWEENGCIEVYAEASGFFEFKLTAYGTDYVEKNFI
ncbi:hypothetical protein [Sporosarcina psychrophila]|uniref:Uncharacterized protein n=1 Tax=Sporosarcina psychrophila TaxID=1476 RepID=A0ABV2KEB1_SPOPS